MHAEHMHNVIQRSNKKADATHARGLTHALRTALRKQTTYHRVRPQGNFLKAMVSTVRKEGPSGEPSPACISMHPDDAVLLEQHTCVHWRPLPCHLASSTCYHIMPPCL